MNAASERMELKKEDQSGSDFFFLKCVGREEEECINPTTTSGPLRPFITPLAQGKEN